MVARECNMQADETHVVCHNSCFYVCVLWEVFSLFLTPYPQTSSLQRLFTAKRHGVTSHHLQRSTPKRQPPRVVAQLDRMLRLFRVLGTVGVLGVVVRACVALGKSCPVERQL